MDIHHRKKPKITTTADSDEVSSAEWETINMTEQEEDLIRRMHILVGERWELIAGRIPERKAEEIERFWIMKHHEGFAFQRRKDLRKEEHPKLLENLVQMKVVLSLQLYQGF